MFLGNKIHNNRAKKFAFVWFVVVLFVSFFLLWKIPSIEVNNNILDMLPKSEDARISTQSLIERSSNKVIFAINGTDKVSQLLLNKFSSSPFVEDVSGRISDSQLDQIQSLVSRYNVAFLPPKSLNDISEPQKYAQKLVRQLYSPLSPITGKDLMEDPLLLVKSSIGVFADPHLSIKDGWLKASDGKDYWTILFVELKRGLKVNQIHEAVSLFNTVIAETQKKYPESEIIFQGIPFHSDAVAETTKNDIVTLGGISLLGLVLIIVWSFGSIKPLLLCLLSIGVGLIFGLSAAIAFFKQLHGITLVMCVSLVGLATDYTTYFCASRCTAKTDESQLETMITIRPSLIHALITTVLAYSVLIIAPFPGLQELAVFAVFGLMASCITVLLWFPQFPSLNFKGNEVLYELGQRFINLWSQNKMRGKAFILIILIFCFVGLNRTYVDDGLISLQKPNSNLITQEKRIASLLGRDFSQQSLIIEADNEEELINSFDKLRDFFGSRYPESSVLSFLPPVQSIERQKQANETIQKYFPAIKEEMSKTGIQLGEVSPAQLLSWEKFLQSPLGKNYRDLYQKQGDKFFYHIPIKNDPEVVEGLLQTDLDIYVYNHRFEIEKVLSHYRSLIGKLLVISFLLIVCSFLWKFGLKSALSAATSLVLSLGCALAALGFAEWPINIFSLFALILVLGIGIDYQVFFQQLYRTNQSALYALLVAAVTTLMSLGILVFSSTLAVQNFGLVLSVGVLTAFLTSPISLVFRHGQEI